MAFLFQLKTKNFRYRILKYADRYTLAVLNIMMIDMDVFVLIKATYIRLCLSAV